MGTGKDISGCDQGEGSDQSTSDAPIACGDGRPECRDSTDAGAEVVKVSVLGQWSIQIGAKIVKDDSNAVGEPP